jgi:hypothetical protein
MKVSAFVRKWERLGFEEEPPNAALVIADAPNSRDVLVVELSNPKLRRHGGLAFRAEVLKGSSTGALDRFGDRADKRVAARFGQMSLFIDPAGTEYNVNFDLRGVANNFTDLRLNGFGITFDRTTGSLSGTPPTVKLFGPGEFLGASTGFLLTPNGYPGNPVPPIDASITISVESASGKTIDGSTRFSGASGTVTVYRGGYTYSEPIVPGERFFSWPIE